MSEAQLVRLANGLGVNLPDGSRRELALNIADNRFYQTGDGQLNRLAQASLLAYVRLFGAALRGPLHGKTVAVGSKLRARPDVDRPLRAAADGVVLSYVQYHANAVVAPLSYQQYCRYGSATKMVFGPLAGYLVGYLDRLCVRNEAALASFAARAAGGRCHCGLLDLVYHHAHREFGLVVGHSGDRYYVLARCGGYGNPNLGFWCDNVLRADAHDVVCVSRCGDAIRTVLAAAPRPSSLPFPRTFSAFHCDLRQPYQLAWMVAGDSAAE